ncbi:MAG TPA: ATP-binding protein [Vicinamibacterales bacterium]|nr:ATP-binding protein [Vicinamibacterales bacterium]
MSDPRRDLAADYAVALQHYLAEPEEPALARAHELGRKALTEGLGVLDMATLHSCALATTLRQTLPDAERMHVLEALEKFFLETLSPFEMAHRGFWETNIVLRRLNEVLEGQAKRIAGQLHNESSQLLATVHFALADVARHLPAERAQEIHAARGLLDQIEQRLRNLAHELRPPILDDMGLVPALEFLADTVGKRWGLPVAVQASLNRGLPATVEATLYRIAQEALTNVARHAKATRAEVRLHQGAHCVACSICDDGVGLDAAVLEPGAGVRGIGLYEIQERVAALGGILHLRANAPQGTDLTVEIPLES